MTDCGKFLVHVLMGLSFPWLCLPSTHEFYGQDLQGHDHHFQISLSLSLGMNIIKKHIKILRAIMHVLELKKILVLMGTLDSNGCTCKVGSEVENLKRCSCCDKMIKKLTIFIHFRVT